MPIFNNFMPNLNILITLYRILPPSCIDLSSIDLSPSCYNQTSNNKINSLH